MYGRAGWTRSAAINLSIGQGENAQTLINMVRFYAALANGGRVPVPHLVQQRIRPPEPVALPDSTFLGIRQSLIAVVERGTARGARLAQLHLAGKTGTAQNPHGLDHGWFIGFAPAERPAIVVGGIFEFGEHGTTVAPYVARVIERYLLGPDSARAAAIVPLAIPDDAKPRDVPLDSPRLVRPRPAAPLPDTARPRPAIPTPDSTRPR